MFEARAKGPARLALAHLAQPIWPWPVWPVPLAPLARPVWPWPNLAVARLARLAGPVCLGLYPFGPT